MAESLDRKFNNDKINDDMIKDALKTGLSSIKASDYLVNKTLLKCQAEIEKGKQEKKPRVFLPWILKLGTPLAAGALVLVLAINTGNLRMKDSSPNLMAAPQASAGDIKSFERANRADLFEAPTPSPSASSVPESEEENDKLFGTVQGESNLTIHFSEKAVDDNSDETKPEEGENAGTSETPSSTTRKENTALFSSSKRETGIMEASIAGMTEPFREIVNVYNQANETELILREEAILRVSCLLKEGVSAQLLIDSEDYSEIISDEGYWALPLVNLNGDIEKILTVCDYDQIDPDAVSGMDIIYTIERNKYIVSELSVGDSIGADLKDLLSQILYSIGDISRSGLVIIDINNGTDFIAITQMGEQTAIVPLLMNDGLYGLKNKKIYNWAFFTRTVGNNLGQ
jgi:hypothetical protein